MKFTHIAMAALLMGCGGGKKVPDAAAKAGKDKAEEPATPAPNGENAVSGERVDDSVSAERPEPEPEPEVVSNADFTAHITHGDGTTTKGHVKRVERSEGWYGEKGWTDAAAKLTVTLEGNGTEVESPWTDIKSISLKYGAKADIDCQFDSEYTPIMYMCVLPSTGTVSDSDGKTWTAGNRHKWRFYFDNDRVEEFWIKKLPEREQESESAESGDGSQQNTELYEKLQKQVLDRAASTAVTKIEINP